MAGVQYNQDRFYKVFGDLLSGIDGMYAGMKDAGDPRDTCVLEVMKVFRSYVQGVLDAVESGKKIVYHCGLLSPEIFLAFENIHPYAMEIPFVMHTFLDPDSSNHFIDKAEDLGLPSDISALDKGFIGFLLEEAGPPVDLLITPMAPCDSITCGHQVIEKIVDAPCMYLEIPYWQDERALDLFAHHVWKLIHRLEAIAQERLDWDRVRAHIHLANEAIEDFISENEMRKLSPCPHPGKLGTMQSILNYAAAGTQGARDACKFILQDSRKLAAAGKGALQEDRARLVWYYPDPLHDLGLHDWIEDEYCAMTVLTMFGHATQTLIDPSTPESIVRGWAWKMMNTAMTRQFRGPHEYFVDDLITAIQGWSADAAVVPLVFPCKHAQAVHGFVRKACRELNVPVLFVEYDAMDPRPVTSDDLRIKVGEFLETQVLPSRT